MFETDGEVAYLLSEAGVSAVLDQITISTPDLVSIPVGAYDATCISCRKQRRFNRDLLAFKFKIATQGAYLGQVLDGYVNIDFGQGKSRTVPTRSKLARWLRVIKLFDPAVSTKRFSLNTFGNYLFVVRVEPSSTDHVQGLCDTVSRVTDIIGVVGSLGRPVQ